nr:hypothetical protein [Tanacetum cinerariifolium]
MEDWWSGGGRSFSESNCDGAGGGEVKGGGFILGVLKRWCGEIPSVAIREGRGDSIGVVSRAKWLSVGREKCCMVKVNFYGLSAGNRMKLSLLMKGTDGLQNADKRSFSVCLYENIVEENELSLYTIWDSLQDITIGLSSSTICQLRVIPSFSEVLAVTPDLTWPSRAIPNYMVWRHPDAAIDDPRPVAGSFSMADVRQHVYDPVLRGADGNVISIHDFLCLSEWTGSEVQEEPYLDVRSTLKRLPFYCTLLATADAVIPDPTLKDLVVGTPSSKIFVKAEVSQKQKASTFGVTSSHVTKRTSDGNDDTCVEIPLVTPLRSATVIHSSGNQGGSFTAPAAEGFNTQGIMVYDATTSFIGVSRPRASSKHAPTFRDVSGDAIHANFFPFSASPYYATYPEGGVARNSDSRLQGCEEKVGSLTGLELQVYTLKKQVSGLNDKLSSFDASFEKLKAKGKERKKKIKSLTKSLDNLHTEVARLSAALNQATILEAEKDEEILRVQAELLSLAASAWFERGLSMHRTKDEFVAVLKNMANFLSGAQDRLAEASPLLAQTNYAFLNKIFEHATEPLSVILSYPVNVPASRDVLVSPLTTKESTVTPASKSLELFTNAGITPSVVASKHNEEMVDVKVDVSDPKMTDDTVVAKSEHAFAQGISVAVEDAVELVEVGSGRASSGPNDVVVALGTGEKGDVWFPLLLLVKRLLLTPLRSGP